MKQADDSRDETQAQRDDRNLMELLQELRVVALGVQVLFGFLLSIPFATGFRRLSPAQRGLYIADLLLAALATALLLTPVAYHRLVFRRHLKEPTVWVANAAALSGIVAVGLAVTGAVALVVSFVAGTWPAAVLAAVTFCMFGALWFVLPLHRLQHARTQREP
jgi:hypothetical protein